MFQLPDKCHNICVAFLENLFIDFTTYVVKRVYKGSLKMDEYYGMFWALENVFIEFTTYVVKKSYYYTREVLKWMNITTC